MLHQFRIDFSSDVNLNESHILFDIEIFGMVCIKMTKYRFVVGSILVLAMVFFQYGTWEGIK